jgi:transcriptional regulator with XRE-family HTH domain
MIMDDREEWRGATIQLRAWLAEDPDFRTQQWLADSLGAAQPTVSQWCAGIARPGDSMRDALAILTGIPAEAWWTTKEKERVRSARAARCVLAQRDTERDTVRDTQSRLRHAADATLAEAG